MQHETTVNDCQLINIPTFEDERGSLSFFEAKNHIPFTIERIFYLYSIPQQKKRGAHAHKRTQQFLICLSGSFSIVVDDGEKTKEFTLHKPSEGLYIPKLIWGELKNFEPDTICLVSASDHYDESEYLRSYKDFTHTKLDVKP